MRRSLRVAAVGRSSVWKKKARKCRHHVNQPPPPMVAVTVRASLGEGNGRRIPLLFSNDTSVCVLSFILETYTKLGITPIRFYNTRVRFSLFSFLL